MKQHRQLQEYSLEREEEIRKFWEENSIPKKVRRQNKDSDYTFYFMDGPPYASGHIHMGTALNKILKDVSMRAKRMQGIEVFDRPGYDTHGVPIEHQIEKELGFKNKKDIEEYGVKKFVDKCRNFATQFIGTMNQEFDNLGVWMDWDNPYMTLSNEYIEAIWWTFKKASEKGLLYLDKYSVHVCPRCATAVAYNEIEYAKATDLSVYVKFPLKDNQKKFLLVWTTTPWTLPGNTGVMVHPDYSYVEAKLSNGETWIVAKDLVQQIMDAVEAGYAIEKEFKGKELEGIRYTNPLDKHMNLKTDNNWYRVILSSRYVNLEEGTGLVHTAPGHGKEDYEEGKAQGLPVFCPVNIDGSMQEITGKYAGKKAKIVDSEIISDLEQSGHLVYKHNYTHDYPFCWRCKSALIMLAVPQWFFRVSKLRSEMIELNNGVKWVPEWMHDRMQNWLENLGDWPISRQRFWGTPLPIWVCECGQQEVVGSIKELSELTSLPKNLDLHKPIIDEVKIPCKCGKKMTRIPEVLDVWFDAGVSSWAALGYPQTEEKFKRFWPASLNIEGTDQVRGWWNSELITSTICFDKAPFNAIAVHGMVLDVKKGKMSKSQGNIIAPDEVIKKYNRDYLRYFMVSSSKGEDFAFDWEAFKDINRFFNIFWNIYNYTDIYLHLNPENTELKKSELQPEDKWILSRFNSLVEQVLLNYNEYTFFKSTKEIDFFVVEDLSRTYIKLIRDRIGSSTEKAVEKTLNCIILNLLTLLAPITPHLSEHFYQSLRTEKMPESVHLERLPKIQEEFVDKKLEEEMNLVKELSQVVLSLREEHSLRLRWPLNKVFVQSEKPVLPNLRKVLASMCNVFEVVESKEKPEGNFASKELADAGTTIFLDLAADNNLRDQWELMELRRRIQDQRKQAKLNPHQTIELFLDCSDKDFLKKFKPEIEKETNTKITIKEGKKEKLLNKEFFIELKLEK